MKHIAIVGATGLIGAPLVAEAASRGYAVTALCRHPDQVPAHAGVEARRCDVFEADALRDILPGHDAVIYSYSPRRDDDEEGRIERHAAATRAVIAATRDAGIARLLAVGGAGTLLLPDGGRAMDAPSFPAMFKSSAISTAAVLTMLKTEANDLEWTFLCPAFFFSTRGRTGVFRLGGDEALFDAEGNSTISTADYAVAMIDELDDPRHTRQRFSVAY